MSEVSEGTVRSHKQGAVGWLIFDNQPRLNAISGEMMMQGVEALDALEADREVRVIVMRGAGEKAFISGGDISKFEKTRFDASSDETFRQKHDELRGRLEQSHRPVIAMIHGYCLGGGLGVALCADLRFGSESCQLGVPAAQRGIAYPPEGLERLVDVVGSSVAKDIMMSARRLKAEEALRTGLLNRVFKPEELERETIAYAETLAANAPLSVRAAKYFINQLKLEKAERDYPAMKRMLSEAANSEDFREATRAFMEKRKPNFRGV